MRDVANEIAPHSFKPVKLSHILQQQDKTVAAASNKGEGNDSRCSISPLKNALCLPAVLPCFNDAVVANNLGQGLSPQTLPVEI